MEEGQNKKLVAYQDSDASAQYCFVNQLLQRKTLRNNQLDVCYLPCLRWSQEAPHTSARGFARSAPEDSRSQAQSAHPAAPAAGHLRRQSFTPTTPSSKLHKCPPSNFLIHSQFVAKTCIKKLFLPLKSATVSEQIKGAELRSKDIPFADFFPVSQKHITLLRAVFCFSLLLQQTLRV